MPAPVTAWDLDPNNNGNLAGIPMYEGMPPNLLNDGVRGLMASVREESDEVRALISGKVDIGPDTGGLNSYVVAADDIAALSVNALVGFVTATTNTGASLITVGTAPQAPLVRASGNPTLPGDVTAALLMFLACDGVSWRLPLTVEPGRILMTGNVAAPAGWHLCDGSAILRATYVDLFGAINTAFGVGDGATTFNLPDMRGRFPRGFDAGAGVDAGRALGSYQADQMIAHTHPINLVGAGAGAAGGGAGKLGATGASWGATNTTGAGTETYPKNVAVNFIIKT